MNNQADDCKLSDTPRTDGSLYEPMGSMCRAYVWDKETFVSSELARTLERELNEAKARIADLETQISDMEEAGQDMRHNGCNHGECEWNSAVERWDMVRPH